MRNISWRDRIAAGVIAPFLFNLSIAVMITPLSMWRRGINPLFMAPVPLLVVFVAVPTVVGLVVGVDRLVDFLGHCFWLNAASERRLSVTLSIWATLLSCAVALALVVAHVS